MRAAAEPLVSVIVPTFNYGRYLNEAVESILAQGARDLEVIVVDDGSTDDTAAVLARITDHRVRAVRKQNGGVAAARNAGLDLARGRFVAFLDADDRWKPDKLERQLALLDSEPEVDIVFSDLSRFEGERTLPLTQFGLAAAEFGQVPTRPARSGDGEVIEGDAFVHLVPLPVFVTWITTVLLRRELSLDVRFPPRSVPCEDLYYMVKALQGARAGFIRAPLTEVRRHGANSYAEGRDKLEPDVITLEVLVRECTSPPHRRVLRRRLGFAWCALGYHHYVDGRAWPMSRAYLHAIRYPGGFWPALKHLVVAPVLRFLPGRAEQF